MPDNVEQNLDQNKDENLDQSLDFLDDEEDLWVKRRKEEKAGLEAER